VTDERLGLTPDEARERAELGLGPGGGRDDLAASDAADLRPVEVVDEEPDLTTSPHTLGDPDAIVADVEPSLIDQDLVTDPLAASGSPDDLEDPVAEGEEVYVPPMDPVITTDRPGDVDVLGGFSPSASEEVAPRRSASDGQIGDEALADAVRLALREDAATTDLRIDVSVEQGIVRLRGTVPGLEDVDNAESVAGRVPGVVDVDEGLDVAEL
jgi:hypothetical protein